MSTSFWIPIRTISRAGVRSLGFISGELGLLLPQNVLGVLSVP